MKVRFLSFEGPEVDDFRSLRRLPGPLRDTLRAVNGFIAFNGAFHLRGACTEPRWHALETVNSGGLAIHKLFGPVRDSDVAFAQDFLGDQFILRGARVYRLHAETAQMENLEMDIEAFFVALQEEPFEILDIEPLDVFQEAGGRLEPGQLLQAEPPFCLREPDQGMKLTAVSARDRLMRLSELGRQMTLVPDAGLFELLGEG